MHVVIMDHLADSMVVLLPFFYPERPVAPEILSLSSGSPNSIHIEWTFTGNQDFIRSYNIQIQTTPDQTNSPWVTVQTRSVSSVTAADITDGLLKAFTLYNVRVTATYQNGNVVPSNSRPVRTGSDVPENSPTEVTGVAHNNSALSISWTVGFHSWYHSKY